MKKFSDLTHRLLFFLVFTLLSGSINLMAQDQQYKARLSVDYQKIMGESETLLINGKFKGEDGYEPTVDLQLNIYHEVIEDSLILLGQTSTDKKGNAVFKLSSPVTKSDSIIKHTYVVKIENSENFKDDDKSVSFMESNLIAETIIKDSINYVSAKFTDAAGEPLEGEKLEVMVHRLFAPLTIGKSSYKTEDDGTILVPIEEPLP